LLPHFLILFHFPFHTGDFLKDWGILEQIWKGDESNATSTKIYTGQFAHLPIPCCSKYIRQGHIHGIFGTQKKATVYFSIFHLPKRKRRNERQRKIGVNRMEKSMRLPSNKLRPYLTSAVTFIPSASYKSLIGTPMLPAQNNNTMKTATNGQKMSEINSN
jgi:hypothetical protein